MDDADDSFNLFVYTNETWLMIYKKHSLITKHIDT
jgi:hypothetical protein